MLQVADIFKVRDCLGLLSAFSAFLCSGVPAIDTYTELRAASFVLKKSSAMQVPIVQVSYLDDLLLAEKRTLCIVSCN